MFICVCLRFIGKGSLWVYAIAFTSNLNDATPLEVSKTKVSKTHSESNFFNYLFCIFNFFRLQRV